MKYRIELFDCNKPCVKFVQFIGGEYTTIEEAKIAAQKFLKDEWFFEMKLLWSNTLQPFTLTIPVELCNKVMIQITTWENSKRVSLF